VSRCSATSNLSLKAPLTIPSEARPRWPTLAERAASNHGATYALLFCRFMRVEEDIPDKRAIKKARRDKRAGKSASTQAGEFVREEIDKIRHGEHGARSTKQAIAIGLSEARRAGVDLPPPKKGQTTERTRRSAEYAYEAGQGRRKTKRRPRVSRAVSKALKREPRSTASRKALSRQAHSAASRRTAALRSASARKAARTKGAAGRSAAAKKAARTRTKRR
jgi:hypothetical protein